MAPAPLLHGREHCLADPDLAKALLDVEQLQGRSRGVRRDQGEGAGSVVEATDEERSGRSFDGGERLAGGSSREQLSGEDLPATLGSKRSKGVGEEARDLGIVVARRCGVSAGRSARGQPRSWATRLRIVRRRRVACS